MSHRTHKPPKFPVTSFSNEVTVAVVGCGVGVGVGVFSFACSEFGECACWISGCNSRQKMDIKKNMEEFLV